MENFELPENLNVAPENFEFASEMLDEHLDEAINLDPEQDTLVDLHELDVINHELDEQQEDQLWQARTGLNDDTLCGAIETIIFMSDRPVPLTKIRNHIDSEIPLRVIHKSLSKLQEEYEWKHHGIRLLEVAEGYQFRTKATYSKFVQDLLKVSSMVLSPTALEVLAIIAYKQPVSRVEIDKIRGVDSSHIVRQLMDKRLVRAVGRSEEVGKPLVYGTTPEFLEVFNLATIEQLPSEYELKQMVQSDAGKISDIKNLVSGSDKQKFIFDEFSELESLSESIKLIEADTEFTKSLKVEEKKRLTEEGEVVKSAFDILEEYVTTQMINDQNKKSVLSDLIMAAIEPNVVNDLTRSDLNTPKIEDEFEMIDLETGEKVSEQEQLLSEEEVQQSLNSVLSQMEDVEDNDSNLLFPEDDDSLESALANAFAKLENSKSELLAEELVESEQMNQSEDHLDSVTKKMIDEAFNLDLNLSFMDEKSTNSDGNNEEWLQ